MIAPQCQRWRSTFINYPETCDASRKQEGQERTHVHPHPSIHRASGLKHRPDSWILSVLWLYCWRQTLCPEHSCIVPHSTRNFLNGAYLSCGYLPIRYCNWVTIKLHLMAYNVAFCIFEVPIIADVNDNLIMCYKTPSAGQLFIWKPLYQMYFLCIHMRQCT